MPKFGVARKYAPDLSDYIIKLNQNNVDAYEMGFAYGIPESIPDETIALAKKYNIALSCHLPFWINLGNSNNEKNMDYLLSGLKIAESLESIAVFHLGFYGDKRYPDLKDNIVSVLKQVLSISGVKKAKMGIETTGKQAAIGTVFEIIELIQLIDDKRVMPVIDWSHLYARSNGTDPFAYDDFIRILTELENEIGYKPSHFHGGGIAYKNSNEVEHISAKSYEPPLPYLFTALQDLGYNDFTFIVETPDSLDDVRWLKDVWKTPKEFFNKIPSKKTRTLFDF
jgi:deoxyribonuclease IV